MKRIFYISTLAFLLIFKQQSAACTAFCLKSGNELFLAKNLDWAIEHGYLFLNEKEEEKSLLNENSFKWKSKYRSITFNQFGKEFPLGGLNEQGLVVEELNMAPVNLIRDSTKQLINEFQLVQYLLDNCKSVDETIDQLEKFQCRPLFQILHYLIADRQGKIIIAEFNGSEYNTYFSNEAGIPVLSNNNYNESLKYLTKFKGFGGYLPIQNRQGSNERFVSVANLLSNFNNQPPVTYSFQILDTVKQKDTKWSLVYDIKNLKVSFKFYACKTVKVFDFKDLIELESLASRGGNLSNCNLTGNDGINAVTSEENTRLIQTVFSLLSEESIAEANSRLQHQMILQGSRNLNGIKNEE